MADQQGSTQQHTHEPETTSYDEQRTQPQIDDLFSKITGGQPDQAQVYVAAYFDLADQTLRTARRVSETWAISLMREQIAADVAQRVVRQLQANPQLFSGSQKR